MTSLVLAWTGVNERTFIAVKPDGVQRRLVGKIVQRFERKGFKLVGLKLVQVFVLQILNPPLRFIIILFYILIVYVCPLCQASEDLLKEHYWDLRRKPFFKELINYMSSGPVVAMVIFCYTLNTQPHCTKYFEKL